MSGKRTTQREPRAFAIAAEDVARLLQAQLPACRRGEAEVASCIPQWTRAKLRKRLGEYQVVIATHGDGRDEELAVIAKAYASTRGAHAFRAMRWLEAHGFDHAAPLTIARALAYDPTRRVLLQEKAQGVELAAAIDGRFEALPTAAHRAARWLAKLHGADRAPFKRARAGAVWSVHRQRRELRAIHPESAPRLSEVCARLIPRLRASQELPAVPTHGDFHPKNIFIAGERVAVIDLDHFGLREPAVDVGYFVGQVLIMSYLRGHGFAPTLPALASFLDTYAEHADAPPTWDRVATHVARTFVQSLHYELAVLHNGRVDLVDPWLAQAEAWLASQSRDDLPALIHDAVSPRTRCR